MRGAMALAVRLYRWSGGRVGGTAKGGTPVLLLTVAGRSTGVPRTTPVSWFEHEGGYLVVGSGGGSADEPQWFRNLRAAPRAHVEVRSEHQDVTVRVLPPDERDRAWSQVVVARSPGFGDYAAKAGRPIPLAHLVPVT
ncbi:nitroreductase/quinone reductase family protein [Cellulomonas endophytica]|uniref:nitroreductase/quinone reductase family protein n=1 Tax=Cellulomonas endophytica TaxID=2494735 RepID=UPI0010129BAF|nr:nitroreductase/quinone reductase family protein [Cellulomonas endophytica]